MDQIDRCNSQSSTKEAIICKVAELVDAKEHSLRESKNRKLTRDRQGTSEDKPAAAAPPADQPAPKRQKQSRPRLDKKGKKFQNNRNKHRQNAQRQGPTPSTSGAAAQPQWRPNFPVTQQDKMDFMMQFMNMWNKS